jgi:hypothetical protein
VPKNILGAH